MDLNQHEIWNEQMSLKFNPDLFITQTGILIRLTESIRIKKSKNILDCQSTSVVLDLGCGPGNLLPLLNGRHIVGLDLSDFLVSQAKQRTQKLDHIEVLKGNAEALPFKDSYFDRLICAGVLEHVLNVKTALSEIYRVTKNGARIIISLPMESPRTHVRGTI